MLNPDTVVRCTGDFVHVPGRGKQKGELALFESVPHFSFPQLSLDLDVLDTMEVT